MKKAFITLCLLSSLSLFANDSDAKELIKEAKCMECHNESDFGGDTSRVKTLPKLHSSVDICQQGNDAEWFEEDSEMVSDYLNKEYYHLKK
jgi:hypothetical protein